MTCSVCFDLREKFRQCTQESVMADEQLRAGFVRPKEFGTLMDRAESARQRLDQARQAFTKHVSEQHVAG